MKEEYKLEDFTTEQLETIRKKINDKIAENEKKLQEAIKINEEFVKVSIDEIKKSEELQKKHEININKTAKKKFIAYNLIKFILPVFFKIPADEYAPVISYEEFKEASKNNQIKDELAVDIQKTKNVSVSILKSSEFLLYLANFESKGYKIIKEYIKNNKNLITFLNNIKENYENLEIKEIDMLVKIVNTCEPKEKYEWEFKNNPKKYGNLYCKLKENISPLLSQTEELRRKENGRNKNRQSKSF